MPKHQNNDTHICVFPCGSYYDRSVVQHVQAEGVDFGKQYATLRVKPGQDPLDVAYMHIRAEQRYFASL
jgi:hypothetical protein